MLSPKQLIADTAKFFAINPSRWTKSRLIRGGREYDLGSEELERTSCSFCAVGYMAHRLGLEDAEFRSRVQTSAYDVVGEFLGIPASVVFNANDEAHSADEVINFLKKQANAI